MRTLLALLMLTAAPAMAAPICTQLTTGMRLCVPRMNTSFDNWGQANINALSVVNSSAALTYSTTAVNTADWLQIRRIGGLSTGTAGVRFSSGVYSDSGAYMSWRGSATFEATGNTQYSIVASSGISVTAGGVVAPFFAGNGAALTGVAPSGPAGGDLSGTFPNPTVIRVQSGAVDLSTVTTALSAKMPLAAINPVYVDLSTVTTALASKQATDTDLDDLADGSLTASKVGTGYPVTSLAAGLLPDGTRILPAGVDLSTVTTALAAKQAADSDLDDLADGSLTASKVASGYDASGLTGRVPSVSVDLSTITTALSGKAASGSNGDITALTGLNAGGLADGTVYGQDIAQSTIPLNKLGDSGCSANQIPKWNGTKWACADDNSAGATAADLVSTQAFSGANTFQSTVTAGASVYYTTATTSLGIGSSAYAGRYVNTWMVVASTNPSGAAVIGFTGLQNNKLYRVTYRLTQNGSSASLRATFNSIGGTGYVYSNQCWASNSSADNVVSAGGAYWQLDGTSSGFAGEKRQGSFDFWHDGTTLIGNSKTMASVTGSHIIDSCQGAAYLTSTFTLSTVELSVTAGTLTGYVYLEQLVTPVP